MKEQNFNEQQSLEVISRMIAETSADIEKGSGRYFLLWGYTTVIVSLFEYFAQLYNLNTTLCLWAWFLIPIIGCIGMLIFHFSNAKGKVSRPKSYIERSINAVWTVFGVSFAMVYIAAIVYGVNILFLTVMLMGMGTVITGIICRHKVLTISGISSILLSLLFPIRHLIISKMDGCAVRELGAAVLYSDILIFAIIFTIMMIIPGHILNHRTKNQHND